MANQFQNSNIFKVLKVEHIINIQSFTNGIHPLNRFAAVGSSLSGPKSPPKIQKIIGLSTIKWTLQTDYFLYYIYFLSLTQDMLAKKLKFFVWNKPDATN